MAETTWLDRRDPTHDGATGRAWRWDFAPDDNRGASLCTWLLNAPYAHPHWEWWMLTAVHLRAQDGMPDPVLQYDGAEYEMLVFALDPAWPVPEPAGAILELHRLSPADHVLQFHDVPQGDTGVRRLIGKFAEAVAVGGLSPDQDHRALWAMMLQGTLEHFRSGMHPITEDPAA